MVILQAILLGIIEGLTEFLPISSTGHLIVAQDLLHYKDTAEIFTVVIQVGAIAAVIWFYRRELWQRVVGLARKDHNTLLFWRNWIVATIPAGLTGLALDDTLGNMATSLVVAITLILGGIAMWLIEEHHHAPKPAKQPRIDSLTLAQSVKIGLFQTLALVPGVSRSGASIMGSLLVGVDRVTATAFSFYLSIPILVIASGYKLATHWSDVPSVSGGGTAIVVGTVAAFITGLVAVKWLLAYVSTHDFKPFAYYRIVVGSLILLGLALNILA